MLKPCNTFGYLWAKKLQSNLVNNDSLDNYADEEDYDDFGESDDDEINTNDGNDVSADEELSSEIDKGRVLLENISLVRKIVEFFKNSSVRNNNLQNTIKKVHGQERIKWS